MTAPSRRRPIVAGNWKMNLLRADAVAYCRALRQGLPAAPAARAARALLFPSFPLIPAVVAELAGISAGGVEVGGQDLHPEEKGAYTGDVSGPQLADAGCAWVLCGHSERRHGLGEQGLGESDELVGRKVAAAGRAGLVPILCLGEMREERRAGRTFEVLARQLAAGLAAPPARFALAYEPVWAIGTGETATAETAQEAHHFLRRSLAELIHRPGRAAGEEAATPAMGEAAEETAILYGGSVTPDNAAELFAGPDVDGFLVGGASLDPQKFLAILSVCV